MGAEVDNQVAAPAEMRTPNLHRAKIAQQRVRMEGWRQRRPGSNGKNLLIGKRKNRLDTNRPSHGRTWLFVEAFYSVPREVTDGAIEAVEVTSRHERKAYLSTYGRCSIGFSGAGTPPQLGHSGSSRGRRLIRVTLVRFSRVTQNLVLPFSYPL